MTRRVVLQGNSSSPFRVSGGSVDAGTADTFDLLFDGNQSPLRIWGVGYVAAAPLASGNIAPAFVTPGPGVIAAPAGQSPIFVINGRRSDGILLTTNHSTGSGGFGAVIANDQFYAVNYSRNTYNGDGSLSFDATIYVNYCVFRNIG